MSNIDVALMCGGCGQRCGEAWRDGECVIVDGRADEQEGRWSGTIGRLHPPRRYPGDDAVALLRWPCLYCERRVYFTARESRAIMSRRTRKVVLPAW